jgi:hypothetical protein
MLFTQVVSFESSILINFLQNGSLISVLWREPFHKTLPYALFGVM